MVSIELYNKKLLLMCGSQLMTMLTRCRPPQASVRHPTARIKGQLTGMAANTQLSHHLVNPPVFRPSPASVTAREYYPARERESESLIKIFFTRR